MPDTPPDPAPQPPTLSITAGRSPSRRGGGHLQRHGRRPVSERLTVGVAVSGGEGYGVADGTRTVVIAADGSEAG